VDSLQKLQVPSSKLQGRTKFQIPTSTEYLILDVSLELGTWHLAFHFLRIEQKISSNSFASRYNFRASCASCGSEATIIRRKNFVSFASFTHRPIVFRKSFVDTASLPSQ
jgi:hypothetical protein